MTVDELKAALEPMPGDAHVFFQGIYTDFIVVDVMVENNHRVIDFPGVMLVGSSVHVEMPRVRREAGE